MPLNAYHKLLCTIGILFFLALKENLRAQASESITLHLENTNLQKAFSAIESQTSYRFVYTSEQLKDSKLISINVTKESLQEVLKKCFLDQPLTFTMEDHFVIIQKKDKETKTDLIEITGFIKNEKGDPVAGATVEVLGKDIATSTSVDGKFVLHEVPLNATITFSGTNVEKQQIIYRNQNPWIVVLKTKINKLDDVQIIAYGTTTNRLNTGDVSMVKSETIAEQPVSNPLGALEGRVPGLVITQSTGVPGSAYKVQIQGQNSLRSDGNDPLYIIDGVPFTSAPISSSFISANIIQQGSPLNNINPADIESISILKDADATSIYGSRGANGVILITTKKGKPGDAKLDLNAYAGAGQVTRMVPMLNTSQYLQMRHEAFANDQETPQPSVDYDLLQWDTTKYTNWQKQLIGGTANMYNLQMNVSGGNANTSFLFGGGYTRETTVFPGDFADTKLSGHININHHSNNQKLSINLSTSYNLDKSNLFNQDITSKAMTLSPNTPDLVGPGNKILWPDGIYDNPYAMLLQTYTGNTNNLIANLLLSYELVRGLEIKLSAGYGDLLLKESQIFPLSSLNPAQGNTNETTYSIFGNKEINTWILEPQLNWDKQIGKGKLNFLLGTTFQENNTSGQTLLGYGFSNEVFMENLTAASTILGLENHDAKYRYNAGFARINYNWEDKYLINLTGRRDGSSRFGPEKQFANFGAIGIAWIFSKEHFMGRIFPGLSFGKLRASYGTTGNDQIGDYGYLDSWTTIPKPYQGITGLQPTQLYNPYFGWETNRKAEIGLVTGFVKDRILLSVNYYQNRSSNQLVGLSLPSITGFTFVQDNLPATVENTGWEFELNTTNIKSSSFTWNMTANLTIPRNKLISFPNLESSGYAPSYVIGQPLNVFKGYHYLGVDPKTGIYQFEDYDKDGQISYPNDYKYVTRAGIDFYGGLLNSFKYKSWKLDVFIQYVQQIGNAYQGGYSGTPMNQPLTVLSRWQKTGDITNVEKFSQDYNSAATFASYNLYSSNYKLGNASFLRLKNVSLSYRLPPSLTAKIKMQEARIYFQAQNLFTITPYQGPDPENQSLNFLAPLRMLTMGIQLNI